MSNDAACLDDGFLGLVEDVAWRRGREGNDDGLLWKLDGRDE